MNKQQIAQVSVSLQELSSMIEKFLSRKAGEPVAFCMVVATGYVMQYVSNASRADGEAMLQSLFDGWKARRADIPAHYNPDLAKVNHAPEAEYDSWLRGPTL